RWSPGACPMLRMPRTASASWRRNAPTSSPASRRSCGAAAARQRPPKRWPRTDVPTTLAVRFPLGRYHATAWDRRVNEGAAEWPPPPWRLLRALTAPRPLRWPQLPDDALDQLIRALAAPPSYHTPPTRAGHTRHYLPDCGFGSDKH